MARVPLSGATLVNNGVGSVQCMMEQTGWTWTGESTGSRADGGMWVQMLLPSDRTNKYASFDPRQLCDVLTGDGVWWAGSSRDGMERGEWARRQLASPVKPTWNRRGSTRIAWMASLAGDPRRRVWWPIDGGNSQQARQPFVLFRTMSRCILHLADSPFCEHLLHTNGVADDEPCIMEGDAWINETGGRRRQMPAY